MTAKEIRAQVMEREGVRKVRVKRDGTIIAIGEMPRGDGGRRTWSQYVGQATEYPWND